MKASVITSVGFAAAASAAAFKPFEFFKRDNTTLDAVASDAAPVVQSDMPLTTDAPDAEEAAPEAGEGFTTLTIETTKFHTITSCAPTVTDCPAASNSTGLSAIPTDQLQVITVVDEIILTTTVCPKTDAPAVSSHIMSKIESSLSENPSYSEKEPFVTPTAAELTTTEPFVAVETDPTTGVEECNGADCTDDVPEPPVAGGDELTTSTDATTTTTESLTTTVTRTAIRTSPTGAGQGTPIGGNDDTPVIPGQTISGNSPVGTNQGTPIGGNEGGNEGECAPAVTVTVTAACEPAAAQTVYVTVNGNADAADVSSATPVVNNPAAPAASDVDNNSPVSEDPASEEGDDDEECPAEDEDEDDEEDCPAEDEEGEDEDEDECTADDEDGDEPSNVVDVTATVIPTPMFPGNGTGAAHPTATGAY